MSHTLPRKLQPILWAAAIMLLGSAIGVAFEPGEWYAALVKPPLTPPSWAFGVVWPTLYALMGIAAWRVWDNGRAQPEQRRKAMRWFAVQLAINLSWSPIVFGLHNLAWGFWWIFLLVFVLVMVMRLFKKIDYPATLMLLPYLWWILFACYLNGMLWVQNR